MSVLLVVAVGACGGGSSASDLSGEKKASADGGAASSTTAPGGEVGASGSDKSKDRAGGKAGAAGKDASGATTTTVAGKSGSTTTTVPEEERTLDITAELASQCVRPGGSQTITIRAMPASGVGYDSVYSDGKSGMMEGFYGGNAGGYTNGDGEYTSTWVVGAHAPEGWVVVRVLGTHVEGGFGETRLVFHISNALGTCTTE